MGVGIVKESIRRKPMNSKKNKGMETGTGTVPHYVVCGHNNGAAAPGTWLKRSQVRPSVAMEEADFHDLSMAIENKDLNASVRIQAAKEVGRRYDEDPDTRFWTSSAQSAVTAGSLLRVAVDRSSFSVEDVLGLWAQSPCPYTFLNWIEMLEELCQRCGFVVDITNTKRAFLKERGKETLSKKIFMTEMRIPGIRDLEDTCIDPANILGVDPRGF